MGHQLTIEPIGQTVEVEEGQTLLDAALRRGVYLPHACCHGLCGTCKVRVREGEVDHGEASSFALMEMEREEGMALACCARALGDLVIEADVEEEPDARNLPVHDHEGTVTRLERFTPTILGVFLRLDAPLEFQAGQYVNLHLPCDGGITRAFSLANAPSTGVELELNVRRVPGGRGTGFLHEALRVGDRVRLAGPYGRFFVRRSARAPMIFMAGGSGLSSPRSMIEELLEEGCELPITLVYGQRTREELYYHARFLELAARHRNFTYVPTLSNEPETSGWTGRRGFVHDAAREHFRNDFRGHKAYLCGPPPMVEACIRTLMQGRLFERDIHTEKFISAADAQQVRSPLFRSL
jgi:phenol/toluene 2-monooxygenase (NADH) P5/A5